MSLRIAESCKLKSKTFDQVEKASERRNFNLKIAKSLKAKVSFSRSDAVSRKLRLCHTAFQLCWRPTKLVPRASDDKFCLNRAARFGFCYPPLSALLHKKVVLTPCTTNVEAKISRVAFFLSTFFFLICFSKVVAQTRGFVSVDPLFFNEMKI